METKMKMEEEEEEEEEEAKATDRKLQEVGRVKMEEIEVKLQEEEEVPPGGHGMKRKRMTDVEMELMNKMARLKVPDRVNSKKRNWGQDHGKDRVIDHLATYNKRKLRAELAALVREHKWEQAAAVVSVLIGAHTRQDHMELLSVADCWAGMEVLRRVEDDEGEEEDASSFIKKIFRLLLRKKQIIPKLRAAVQLELGLYLMSQKDYDGCYTELRALVDVPPYRDDPLINFWYGLNLHHLWYEKVSEDVKKYAAPSPTKTPVNGRASSLFEGTGETAGIDPDHRMLEHPHLNAVQVEDTPGLAAAGHTIGEDGLQDMKPFRPMAYDNHRQGRLYNDEDLAGDEVKREDWSSSVIVWSPDLDRRIFPVCLPERKDNPYYCVPLESSAVREAHSGAVKHLQRALSLDPCLTEALLPLTQLLLAVGNVNDTMLEINRCCQAAPNHVVPFSLKVLVMEELRQKDHAELARTYRKLIDVNPSSISALEALIALHSSGCYDTLLLMEAIATHLDVEAGTSFLWDKLAACFKAVIKHIQHERSQSLEGRCFFKVKVEPEMPELPSSKVKVEEPVEESPCATSKKTNEAHILRRAENIWADRRRWWGRKHFSTNTTLGGTSTLELALWKAVCAAHVMGPGCAYERNVRQAFERGEKVLLLRRLNKHVKTPAYSLLHSQPSSCETRPEEAI